MFRRFVVLAALGTAILLTTAPAYADNDQVANIRIIPRGLDLTIAKVAQTSGHWRPVPQSTSEINNNDVQATLCKDGAGCWVCAQGATGTATGCDGYFELYDGPTQVCTVHFISPYSGSNTWELSNSDKSKYLITTDPVNPPSGGALGTITINIKRLGQ